MYGTRGAGVSPPQQGNARAGIAGAEPMNALRTRLIRFGSILALITFLASGIVIEPRQAIARPAPTGGPDGNPYGSGDPTGDDLPSPTPKPNGQNFQLAGSPTRAQTSFKRFDRWSIYFRILIRLGIR
jgi:hypothetical protein